jgi:hypothetical protein
MKEMLGGKNWSQVLAIRGVRSLYSAIELVS